MEKLPNAEEPVREAVLKALVVLRATA
jgi:hypothetical protein